MRDLTDASPAAIAAERARVPREGLGAEILASPGIGRLVAPGRLPRLVADPLHAAPPARDRRRPRRTCGRVGGGAPARRAFGGTTTELLGEAKPFFEGEVEPCINGGALALGALLRAPGGEPRASSRRRATRGRRLELRSAEERALVVPHHDLRAGGAARVRACRRIGAGDRGGQTARRGVPARARSLPAALDRRGRQSGVPEFAFPPRYHYDVLRALDYFRAAGVQPDARISEAVHVIESRRQADGRWLLDRAHDEALALPFGESAGEPSRWNTLRALRVLRWYELAQRTADAT